MTIYTSPNTNLVTIRQLLTTLSTDVTRHGHVRPLSNAIVLVHNIPNFRAYTCQPRPNALTRLSFGARTENAQQLLVPARAKTRTRRYLNGRKPKSGLASRFSHAVTTGRSRVYSVSVSHLCLFCPLSAVRNKSVTRVCPFERTLLLYRNFLRRNTGRPIGPGKHHRGINYPGYRGKFVFRLFCQTHWVHFAR